MEKQEMLDAIKEQFEAQTKGLINETALTEKLDAIKDSLVSKEYLKEFETAVEKHGLALEKMNDSQPKVMKSVRDFLVDTKSLDKLKSREQSEFIVKAVGDVTTANVVVADTQPVMSILGVAGQPYAINRNVFDSILDEVDMGATDKATIVYVDEVEGEGTVGTTAEGIAKNQIDVDFKEVTVSAIKKTGLVKVTEESLDDISYMAGEINRVLTEKLGIVESKDIADAVVAAATTFSLTDYDDTVVDADIVDAIVAATVQSELSGYNPTSILMHPKDVAAFQLIKSANLPRVSTVAGRMVVNGLNIIKTTQIDAGTFVIGDFKKYRVRRYKNKLVMGWDADDFSKNKRTIIAESRYIKYVSTNEATTFVKGVFATVIAALLKP